MSPPAFAGAATVVEAQYDVPFQGHTAFGPAHALADPSNDQLTIYSNDMKSYGHAQRRRAVPEDPAREESASSGCRGRRPTAAPRPKTPASKRRSWPPSSAARCAMQWTRQEETGWDTKGPAYAINMRGALDAQGPAGRARLRRARRRLQSRRLQRARHGADRAADRAAQGAAGARPRVVPVGQVRHSESPHGRQRRADAAGVGNADPHGQPARSRRPAGHVRVRESSSTSSPRPRRPIRSRSACALLERGTGDDAGFKRARSIAVPQGGGGEVRLGRAPVAAAARRPATSLTGRGVAYAYRSETVVAEIVEVEVNRRTGRVWVKRIVCAHDCGLVINPEALTPHARRRHCCTR